MKLPEFMSGLENWMRTMEDAATVLVEKFMKVESIPGLLFNIFMIAIIPALGEELMFRGVIQRIFSNWTKITIGAFGSPHFCSVRCTCNSTGSSHECC